MTGSADAEDNERSPIERALDVGVYAPLGFALEFRRLVPELAEAGRRQVAFSRSLGKAALSTLGKAAAARRDDTTPAAPQAPKAAPTPPRAPSAAAKTSSKKSASKPAAASSGVVDGYDGLTAREIIALSAAATPAQRTWMLERERGAKQRKTVLKALTSQ